LTLFKSFAMIVRFYSTVLSSNFSERVERAHNRAGTPDYRCVAQLVCPYFLSDDVSCCT
jgi:hypothetical protein